MVNFHGETCGPYRWVILNYLKNKKKERYFGSKYTPVGRAERVFNQPRRESETEREGESNLGVPWCWKNEGTSSLKDLSSHASRPRKVEWAIYYTRQRLAKLQYHWMTKTVNPNSLLRYYFNTCEVEKKIARGPGLAQGFTAPHYTAVDIAEKRCCKGQRTAH